MSLFEGQSQDIKPSQNVWYAISADLAAITAAINGPRVEPEDLVENTEGNGNTLSEPNKDTGSGEVDPQSLVDMDGSELPDDRSRDMLVNKDSSSLSPVHVQFRDHISVTQEPSSGPQVALFPKSEPDIEEYSGAVLVTDRENLVHERNQLFSDSTDEDLDSEEGEEQTEREDNALGELSGFPEQTVEKEPEQNNEKDASAASASTLEGLDGYDQHEVKAQDQWYRAEWIEAQGASLLFPPGLEKLQRVFTSLNTACGLLQKQQLVSSWQNVKEALQQLSSAGEVMAVEDIRQLARFFPRMVVLNDVSGEGEDASFNIELYDPSEPKNSELLGMSGRKISDTEARLVVERRQKAFQVLLVELAKQLQPPQGNAIASKHSKHAPIHSSTQRHLSDGHHTMGPPILALPTQNLVFTPPPQPGFISIPNGYRGLPFPIQVQPASAYALNFPPQQANNYAGYQLSSMPSTSQASGLNNAQPTPPLVPDSTDPAGTPEPSSFYQRQSLNQAKRRRGRNWDTWEVVLLVQAKKYEWELSETACGQDRFETSRARWRNVERFLKENEVVERNAAACRKKWESLLCDYKAVSDWNRKTGNAPYNSLTPGQKKAATLPHVFSSKLLDLLDSFHGKSAHVSPPSVVDSLATSAPEDGGGAASGGDGSGTEESEESIPHVTYSAEEIHGSGRKRKKSQTGSSPLVAAFDRMTASMINIAKGRDERSERALALENRKYELERSILELQERKLEIQREDNKSLVRVLGNIAGAFHRMADKM